ncbi:MAG: beta-ketoacyl synthase N-terminal-like domain-containing protein [Pseudomonadota bacterium]
MNASADNDAWSGELAITGMGLVTPVGLTAKATCAALRAGVSRLRTLSALRLRVAVDEFDDVKGACVPNVTEGLQGPARLKAMMRPALEEAIRDAQLSEERLAVYLGTSGSRPGGRMMNHDAAVRDNLLDSLPADMTVAQAKLVQSGRTAVQKSLRLAARALEEGSIDAAVIGASDSWVSPRALRYLHQQGRLAEYPRHTGAIPAEAAGFLVVEPAQRAHDRGATVYAVVRASAGAREAQRWGDPMQGHALARAIRAVRGDTACAHAVVVSDLDGERYRTLEWLMAEGKAMWNYHTMDHWNPADCVGDSGAAMGAVLLAWASMALHRNYAGATDLLLWGAADEGAREALLMSRQGGEAHAL